MNVLTGIVLAILAVMMFIGWRKGLIKMLYALLAVVIAIVLTILISPLTKNMLLTRTGIYQSVYEQIDKIIDFGDLRTTLTEMGTGTNANSEVSDGSEAIDAVDEMLIQIGIPENVRQSVLGEGSALREAEEQADQNINDQVTQIENGVVAGLTNIVINAVSFIITLVVVGIIVFGLGLIFNLIGNIPVIHGINKISGMVAGIFMGYFIVSVLFGFATMLGTTSFGIWVLNQINGNAFLTYLYNNNIVIARIFS